MQQTIQQVLSDREGKIFLLLNERRRVLGMFLSLCLYTADSESIDKVETHNKNKNTGRKGSALRRRQARATQATWGKGQVRLGRILARTLSPAAYSQPQVVHLVYSDAS